MAYLDYVESRKRPLREQVKTGLRVGFGIVGAILVFFMAGDGFRRLSFWDARFFWSHGLLGQIVGCGELLTAALVMFTTARGWAAFVPAWLAIGGLSGVVIFFTGRSLRPPYLPISRLTVAEYLLGGFVIIATTVRFTGKRPKVLDKIAITIFVLALAKAATLAGRAPTVSEIVFEATGVGFLIVAWGVDRWNRWRSEQRRSRPKSNDPVLPDPGGSVGADFVHR